MAVYTPETAADLINALRTRGAEIICPENFVYDCSGMAAGQIPIQAASVEGNGATIRNLTVASIMLNVQAFVPTTTTISNLTIDSLVFTKTSLTRNAAFVYNSVNETEHRVVNFNNCIISAQMDDKIVYLGSASTNYRTSESSGITLNFFGSSINVGIERSDFLIYKNGVYKRDSREMIANFECCKMAINAPNIVNGKNALDCYHKKCDIYFYMPRWTGDYYETPSGYTLSDYLDGQSFQSCLLRGNLSSLGIVRGIEWSDAETENLTILCANLASNVKDPANWLQLRRSTDEDAKDSGYLLGVSTQKRIHFDLVVSNPTNTDWQIDGITNDGFPFISAMPGMIQIKPFILKKQKLRIYDMRSTSSQLRTNGLAMLDCTEATVHEVFNGEWTLTFTHPIDKHGKWKHIKESNIVKCLDQYFTIVSVVWEYKSRNSGTVTANCEHIFYQNNDHWIYPENIPLSYYYSCKPAMDAIMAASTDFDDSTMTRFLYEWSSDWNFDVPFMFAEVTEGCTPVNAMIGSGGIIGLMGGELYRDNFYFSIQERMENAKDNAFDIRFGNNCAGMRRTVDASTLCTHFTMYDSETGSWWAVSYSNEGFPLFQFPHTVARSQSTSFSPEIYEKAEAGELDITDLLAQVGMQVWMSTCTPVLCYEVDIADHPKNLPDGISVEQDYKVGDQGRIHDEMLGGDIFLRITETEKDGITGKCKKVTFGSKNSFTRAVSYPKAFDGMTTPTQTVPRRIRDASGFALRDSNGNKIVKKEVF